MSDKTSQNDHQSYTKQQSIKSKERRNFFLFTIIPFILLNTIIFFAVTTMPDFTLDIIKNADFKTVNLTVTQTSIYPLKSFIVKLDETEIQMEVHKEGFKTIYEATLTTNGGLSVEAINLNGMRKIAYDQIDSIDTTPPLILDPEETENSKVSISLEDDQSGIDFDKLYAIDARGNNIRPELIDKENSSVVFPYDTDSLEIHVVDKVGNQSVANFSRIDRRAKRDTDSDEASDKADSNNTYDNENTDKIKQSKSSTRAENKTQGSSNRQSQSTKSTKSESHSKTKASSTAAKSSTKNSSKSSSGSGSKSTAAKSSPAASKNTAKSNTSSTSKNTTLSTSKSTASPTSKNSTSAASKASEKTNSEKTNSEARTFSSKPSTEN